MTRKQALEIDALIKRSKKILVTTHINPDGDGIGTGCALVRCLEQMGKTVDFINRDPMPEIYKFLPGSEKIKNMPKVYGKYDLIIFLECPDLDRNGHIIDHITQTGCSINIDHHPGNVMYADLNVVEPKAAAVGIQLYNFMKHAGWKIDKEMAYGLYTAILTDTGSFGYSNASPEVHMITSKLIARGAKPSEISGQVFSTSEQSTRLLAKMLNKLKIDKSVGWSVLTRAMFKDTGAKENDTDNFINFIRSIRTVDVAVLFKEINSSMVKVSFRSKHGIDVNVIAAGLSGGGHKYASGCVVKQPLAKAVKTVLGEVGKYYRTRKKEK
jgi:phosphoesterase RecJ-like protein